MPGGESSTAVAPRGGGGGVPLSQPPTDMPPIRPTPAGFGPSTGPSGSAAEGCWGWAGSADGDGSGGAPREAEAGVQGPEPGEGRGTKVGERLGLLCSLSRGASDLSPAGKASVSGTPPLPPPPGAARRSQAGGAWGARLPAGRGEPGAEA